MLKDVWYTYQEIYKQKKGQKYSWGVPQKIFLDTECKEQSQAKTDGGKNMENESQIHLRNFLQGWARHFG